LNLKILSILNLYNIIQMSDNEDYDEGAGSEGDNGEDDITENIIENEEEEEEEEEKKKSEEEVSDEDNIDDLNIGDLDLNVEIKEEDCYQKSLKKKSIIIEDKALAPSAKKWGKYNIVDTENRITGARMTTYEYIKALGVRTSQFQLGAPSRIEVPRDLDYEALAALELKNKATPFIVMRPLPGNLVERWYIRELEIPEV